MYDIAYSDEKDRNYFNHLALWMLPLLILKLQMLTFRYSPIRLWTIGNGYIWLCSITKIGL